MRNSPENTLTPLELTAPQDWIQVPNPRRQLPTPPLRLSFIWRSGAAMGCQRGQRGCCGWHLLGAINKKKKKLQLPLLVCTVGLSLGPLSYSLMSALMRAEGFCHHHTRWAPRPNDSTDSSQQQDIAEKSCHCGWCSTRQGGCNDNKDDNTDSLSLQSQFEVVWDLKTEK